jgi:hypothetical protein
MEVPPTHPWRGLASPCRGWVSECADTCPVLPPAPPPLLHHVSGGTLTGVPPRGLSLIPYSIFYESEESMQDWMNSQEGRAFSWRKNWIVLFFLSAKLSLVSASFLCYDSDRRLYNDDIWGPASFLLEAVFVAHTAGPAHLANHLGNVRQLVKTLTEFNL